MVLCELFLLFSSPCITFHSAKTSSGKFFKLPLYEFRFLWKLICRLKKIGVWNSRERFSISFNLQRSHHFLVENSSCRNSSHCLLFALRTLWRIFARFTLNEAYGRFKKLCAATNEVFSHLHHRGNSTQFLLLQHNPSLNKFNNKKFMHARCSCDGISEY